MTRLTDSMRDLLEAMGAGRGRVLRRNGTRLYLLCDPETLAPTPADSIGRFGRLVHADTGQVRALLARGLVLGDGGHDADAGDIFRLTAEGLETGGQT